MRPAPRRSPPAGNAAATTPSKPSPPRTAPLLGYGSPRLNYYDPRNTEAGDYAALLKLRAMLRTKSASATGEARLHYELLLRNIEKALKK